MTTQMHAQYRLYTAELEGHYITMSTLVAIGGIMKIHESVYLLPGESVLHPCGAVVVKVMAEHDAGVKKTA